MSRFYKYFGRDTCYFITKRKTDNKRKSYQVTEKGMQLLEQYDIRLGNEIPRWLIKNLIDQGGAIESGAIEKEDNLLF